MNLLFLGPPDATLREYLLRDGNAIVEMEDPIYTKFIQTKNIDFIISYGYRHIIGRPVLEFMKDRVINLHISYLPWNRGADPNLWSFLEDTPKGVSIHYIDEGIDTGDILIQKELFFNEAKETLESTYQKLQNEMIQLFKTHWPLIKEGTCQRMKHPADGSYHKSADKKKFEYLLSKGWDTPVIELKGKAISHGQ